MKRPRVLLVGESNPHSGDPRYALYPEPAGAAGSRLCKILDMGRERYLQTFDRVNLLGEGRWSARDARAAADALKHKWRVLLGARVATAHGLGFEPFEATMTDDYAALVLPHPSGRCRIWNDRDNVERAREALARFMAIARGEA